MKHHTVAITIEVDMAHTDVQSRVLMAVLNAFNDDRGGISVTGIDLVKLGVERETLREERDAYRTAWLAEQEKAREVETALEGLREKIRNRFESPEYKREGPRP